MFLEDGKLLPKIEQFVAGGSSHELNLLDNAKRTVWDDYWEKIVDDKDLEKLLGYILGNPLKHGEVKNFKELKENPFTNYKQAVAQYGEEMVQDLILSVDALDLENRTDYEKLFKSLAPHRG